MVWTDEVGFERFVGVLEAWASASLVWTDELVLSGSLDVFGSEARQVWFGRVSWF